MPAIRVTYDEPSDVAYISSDDRISRNVSESRICEEYGEPVATILDIDQSGHVVGIEVLNAPLRLPERLLSEAEREPPPST